MKERPDHIFPLSCFISVVVVTVRTMRNYLTLVSMGLVLLSCLSCGADRVTLDLAGGPETIDASVFINGENSGSMTKSTDGSSRFAKSLPSGKLDIEVRKEGYLPFRETIM